MNRLLAIVIGFILDLILGDPQWLYHPIRFIGKLISVTECIVCKIFKKHLLFGGVIIVAVVLLISATVTYGILHICYKINAVVGITVESILCYFMLAAKSLKTESMRVYNCLAVNDAEGGRYAVSMIVGRDTESLDTTGITKAAVETVAENTSDGVIAPLFYMAIGGGLLGVLYKAANTMDSMLGYKNEKYIYLGRAAARLDDVLNFIPSRLSAVFMIISAFLLGYDWRNAIKIYLRDRKKHSSPNSAHTEAVCAGALQIRLAGDAFYFGKLHKKPFIGDEITPVKPENIIQANRLMYMTAVLALIVFTALGVWFI